MYDLKSDKNCLFVLLHHYFSLLPLCKIILSSLNHLSHDNTNMATENTMLAMPKSLRRRISMSNSYRLLETTIKPQLVQGTFGSNKTSQKYQLVLVQVNENLSLCFKILARKYIKSHIA
jgi:hypothetical protein